MTAILILLIITVQALIGYLGVKYLLALENKLATVDNQVCKVTPKVKQLLRDIRAQLVISRKAVKTYDENQTKIKKIKTLWLVKSALVGLILLKKQKSIFKFWSLYEIVNNFSKAIMEF